MFMLYIAIANQKITRHGDHYSRRGGYIGYCFSPFLNAANSIRFIKQPPNAREFIREIQAAMLHIHVRDFFG